ncbi:MAG: carboxylesterase/lipase family protein, partial [Steroidobacteraceae bacterium]
TVQGGVAGGVEFFKGIPYAAPPVGALRWEPPQSAAHWDGVREATEYAHDCMQKPFPYDAAPLRTTPSEDCLYLNIWRPAGAHGLPVMVWIYGGGFVNGGTSPAAYDGSHLARKGVVLVSFNYRLGRFGFFAFPALTASHPHDLLGNYGYMDQIAALKWVKANIAAFGGDPGNVMVFGESAGGGSVHMLLTSPLAAGLFERAAVESGGGRDNLMGNRQLSRSLPGLPSGEAIGVNFARANGIHGTDAAALAALRALSADKVCAGLGMMSTNASGPPTYSGPLVDGRIVVRSPEAAYRSGRFAHVPLLIGANSADLGITNAKTIAQALAPFGADRGRALAAYDPDHSADAHLVAARVASDRTMVEPARFDATEFTEHGVPAYEYRFSYVAPAAAAAQQKGPFAKTMVAGAQHASEIPYVFDTIAAVLGSSVTQEDQSIGEAASSYWANFARTGNPNGGSLPTWPAYSPRSDELMNFTETGPMPMSDPWHARLNLTAAHAHQRTAARR